MSQSWEIWVLRSWLSSLQLGLQPGFGPMRGLQSLRGPPIRPRHLNFAYRTVPLIKSWVFCENEPADTKWLCPLVPAFIRSFCFIPGKVCKLAVLSSSVQHSERLWLTRLEPCQYGLHEYLYLWGVKMWSNNFFQKIATKTIYRKLRSISLFKSDFYYRKWTHRAERACLGCRENIKESDPLPLFIAHKIKQN